MIRLGLATMTVVVVACLTSAPPVTAQDGGSPGGSAPLQRGRDALTVPPSLDRPPAGFTRTASEVSRTAGDVAKIRAARAGRRDTYARPYLKGSPDARRWQVSFYAPAADQTKPNEQIGQVVVDDRTGRVIEAWTGPQVAWTMARGYPGAFGRTVNSPYVWIGLSLLFIAPFARRPLRLLHLDLVVLLAFSVSYAFFGAADIDASVPLVYPGLIYLLVRLVALAAARSRGRSPEAREPLRLAVPYRFLVIALVFLIGFRVGLNVETSNVIDVGYSGVIGADRVAHGELPYGSFPPDDARGDTYGPAAYYAYVPFEAVLPWSGRWDDLPAAHAAAVAFDLACMALMFLVGRRIRGPALGVLLAYAWATFPFTLLVANSNSNDGLVAALVLLVLLAIARPAHRGAAVALAGLTKFAPLALGPLAATYRGGGRAGQWAQGRSLGRPAAVTAVAAVVAGLVLLAPVLLEGRLALFYERTLGFQNDRGSPFSVWGLYDLPGPQAVVQVLAAVLALAVAFVPRRRDVVVVAALGAAVLIALQLGLTYWFYLYLVWFFPLALIAFLAPHAEPDPLPQLL